MPRIVSGSRTQIVVAAVFDIKAVEDMPGTVQRLIEALIDIKQCIEGLLALGDVNGSGQQAFVSGYDDD